MKLYRGWKRQARRCLHEKRGASLVEFALVVPLLVALLLGIIEFGWLFNAQITLTSLAREGARKAAVQEFEDDGVLLEAIGKAHYFEELSIAEYSREDEDVKVHLQGEIIPLVGFFVSGDGVTLEADSTMRKEY